MTATKGHGAECDKGHSIRFGPAQALKRLKDEKKLSYVALALEIEKACKGKTARPGLLKCGDCNKQFTVTVGTLLSGARFRCISVRVESLHKIVCSCRFSLRHKPPDFCCHLLAFLYT